MRGPPWATARDRSPRARPSARPLRLPVSKRPHPLPRLRWHPGRLRPRVRHPLRRSRVGCGVMRSGGMSIPLHIGTRRKKARLHCLLVSPHFNVGIFAKRLGVRKLASAFPGGTCHAYLAAKPPPSSFSLDLPARCPVLPGGKSPHPKAEASFRSPGRFAHGCITIVFPCIFTATQHDTPLPHRSTTPSLSPPHHHLLIF